MAISREIRNIETEKRRQQRSGEGTGQCLRNIPAS
ncbi:unnamed protein product [Ixodes persulcatus]